LPDKIPTIGRLRLGDAAHGVYIAKMSSSFRSALLGACLALAACGTPPAKSVDQATSEGGAPSAAKTESSGADQPRVEIPPPPASCKGYASAVPAAKSCPDVRAKLAQALAKSELERDRALVELEGCNELPAGVVRALRVELIPTECGDVLAEPWIAGAPSGQRADLTDALRGLALAAQANRLVRDPPKLEPPYSKARVVEFTNGPLAAWIRRQAAAVHAVSLSGAALTGYGKAIVAVEAGLADMRFVEAARSVPLPDEFKSDTAAAEAYYAALDDALEPRKVRGRDAALVGMGKLAEVGVRADPRVQRARALLSTVYAGRRIDALDALLLPDLPPAKSSSPDERIASTVPTFYAPLLLPDLDATRPGLLRALIERGLPASARTALDGAKLAPEIGRLHARAIFELGRTYWRASDFAKSRELALRYKQAGAELPLLAAIGEVLAKGPRNAAEMIIGGPHLPSGIGQVAALEQAGKDNRSLEGFAAFDAALLLELARPQNADSKYFEDIAKRYGAAEKRLPPEHRARAAERRRAAEQTAKAVAKAP
jgi:hypothetical protein